jgi:membrane-associated HD superfamily phosphohydrolase
MEVFGTILTITMLLFFLFFVLKTQIKPKSKAQKQEEIRSHYLQKLQSELESIDNPQERQKRKIALLKLFAKELEFNLFFDKEKTKNLIKELASY